MKSVKDSVTEVARNNAKRYKQLGTDNEEIYMRGFIDCLGLFADLIEIVDKNTDNVERFIDGLQEKIRPVTNQ